MRDLPAGVVTPMFTDVEGSTRLLHEHGEDYGEAVQEHRRQLRAAFSARGGVEADTSVVPQSAKHSVRRSAA